MRARLKKQQASIAHIPYAAKPFPSAPHPHAPPESYGFPLLAQRGLGEREAENRVSLSRDLYVSLVELYGKQKALAEGKEIHALFVQDGFDADRHVGNLLINLYTKCYSITDARSVFDHMPGHDVYAWTMMISGYATLGHAQDAIALHNQMELEGAQLDRVSCLAVLKACASEGALHRGKQMHAFMFTSGINLSVTIGNSLIDMYAKCGNIEHAWQVFDTMPNRDAISWNIMIAGFARLGHTEEAFSFFRNMDSEQFEPDEVTFLSILKACSNIEQGKHIHTYILKKKRKLTAYIGNTLINLYTKCESIADACAVFDQMRERDTLTWTMVIAAYAKQHFTREPVILFSGMGQEGVLPNEVTFVSTLTSCSILTQGKLVHAQYIANRFPPNVVVGNTLIDMYARCGSLQHALVVFNEMHERDIVSWNTLIAGYANYDLSEEACDLFQELVEKYLEPDAATYLSVIKACSSMGEIENCHLIHYHIIERKLDIDVYLESAIVDMYAKCGSLPDACHLFDKMAKHDVVSWNTIMSALVHYGLREEAFHFFMQMEHKGLNPDAPSFFSLLKACITTGFLDQGRMLHAFTVESALDSDSCLSVSLIDFYAKSGSTEDACWIFERIAKLDVVSWNAMIAGHAEHEHFEKALKLFEKMKLEEVSTDTVTYVGVLKASASLAALDKGMEIHSDIVKVGLEDDVYVGSTLVDMYGKCGNMQDGYHAFQKMHERDAVTWNAVIAGYALAGLCDEALETFKQMQLIGVAVCSITLVSVLSACCHAGLIFEGCEFFDSMSKARNSIPTIDHYACKVDLLGRAGLLQEGLNFIEHMPIQPSVVVWTALLGACKVAGEAQVGLLAAEPILELEPNNDITLLQLLILYHQLA